MSDNHKTESEPHETHPNEPIQSKVEYLPALFLVTALFFLPKGTEAGSLNALAIVFVSIVLEAIPFMLVGSLVGGFIEAFISRERMATLLPRKGWLTVCIAAGAGLVFPVCECAVVPVVRRLTGKGLPFSAAIAYLLGGPIVNPIVAAIDKNSLFEPKHRKFGPCMSRQIKVQYIVGLFQGPNSGASAIRGD